MAQFLRPNRRSLIRGAGRQARADFFFGVADIIGQEMDEKVDLEDQRQISNAEIALQQQWDDMQVYMTENAHQPDLWQPEYDKRKTKWRDDILKNVTQPGARKIVSQMLNEKFGQWKGYIDKSMALRKAENAEIDFNTGSEYYLQNRIYKNEDDFLEKLFSFSNHIASGVGRYSNVATEDLAEEVLRSGQRKLFSDFMLQQAEKMPEKEAMGFLDVANDYAQNLGLEIDEKNPLFSPDDIADLKKDYTNRINYQAKIDNAQLQALKDKATRDIYGRFVRNELTDVEEAINAYEQGILDKSVLDDILSGKDSSKEDNPDALMESNRILTDLRRGYLSKNEAYRKISALRNQIKNTTFKGKIEDIETERTAYENEEIKEAKDAMEDAIRTKGTFGLFIEDDVEDAAWAQSDAVLDDFIRQMRKKDGALDTYEIKKEALKLGRAAKVKVMENKRAKGKKIEEVFGLPETEESINQRAIIPPKGKPAGNWGVHDGKGKIILNERGIRGLLSIAKGKTIEEKIADARQIAEKRGYIIPK